MPKFLSSPLAPDGLLALLKLNLALCLTLFIGLELWRPYFFLTDDNLSGNWPLMIEIGRHLKSGQSPFISDYLFGGRYDLSRDISASFWHPFYLLPALLAGTAAQSMIMDLIALLFLLLGAAGFTLMAGAIVREFNLKLPVIYIVFYTASWLFSSYILTVGSSWIQFLGNESALPWLALGVLNGRLLKGTALVFLFTIHEIFSSYAPSIMINAICVFMFACGITLIRRSPTALFNCCFGSILAILVSAPFLVHILQGFAVSQRAGGFTVDGGSLFSVPPAIFPFSFFFGNWTGLFAACGGLSKDILNFPYASVLLASAAAWCLLPALFNRAPWRGVDTTCVLIVWFLYIMTTRPPQLGYLMSHLIFIRSMRWPFRECLQLLFFLHLFLLVRPPGPVPRWEGGTAIFSLLVFVLPLGMPFTKVPTFNPLYADRAYVLSGRADIFWGRVKALLKPTDDIATVIPENLWSLQTNHIPYSLGGTANFPAYFQVRCISGYAPTAPKNQVPLKIPVSYWFGAFDETQVAALLKARPDLKIIEVEGVRPLRLRLISKDKTIDLSPLIPPLAAAQ